MFIHIDKLLQGILILCFKQIIEMVYYIEGNTLLNIGNILLQSLFMYLLFHLGR